MATQDLYAQLEALTGVDEIPVNDSDREAFFKFVETHGADMDAFANGLLHSAVFPPDNTPDMAAMEMGVVTITKISAAMLPEDHPDYNPEQTTDAQYLRTTTDNRAFVEFVASKWTEADGDELLRLKVTHFMYDTFRQQASRFAPLLMTRQQIMQMAGNAGCDGECENCDCHSDEQPE